MSGGGLFPEPTIDDVRDEDKLAELIRELDARRQVYPRLVAKGTLTEAERQRRVLILESIIRDYQEKLTR